MQPLVPGQLESSPHSGLPRARGPGRSRLPRRWRSGNRRRPPRCATASGRTRTRCRAAGSSRGGRTARSRKLERCPPAPPRDHDDGRRGPASASARRSTPGARARARLVAARARARDRHGDRRARQGGGRVVRGACGPHQRWFPGGVARGGAVGRTGRAGRLPPVRVRGRRRRGQIETLDGRRFGARRHRQCQP